MNELKSKLEQAKKDREAIDSNIKDLKNQIEEANKIKPKHGDIVINELGFKRIVIKVDGEFISFDDERLQIAGTKYIEKCYQHIPGYAAYKVIGNVFD